MRVRRKRLGVQSYPTYLVPYLTFALAHEELSRSVIALPAPVPSFTDASLPGLHGSYVLHRTQATHPATVTCSPLELH